MALKTSDEYRSSLRDGRRVVYRGALVEDVTTHHALSRTIDHAAALWDHPGQGPAGMWAHHDEAVGEEVSAYYARPTDAAALTRRGDLIEETTFRARSTLNVVKAIGTDALLAIELVGTRIDQRLRTEYAARARDFRDECARGDLSTVVAATDAKGDRTLRPSAQHDPDLHVRVVARDGRGITVRGAKLHTTASPSANALIVLPGRAMTEADADYAVAFAVPINAPGLTLVCHPSAQPPPAEAPVSSRNVEVETLTIFDDVFVPWERVFLCGEWQEAGALASSFAGLHRFTAISYKPPFVDLLIGAAALTAEHLGLTGTAAFREKLGRLIVYGELVRTARVTAAVRCRVDDVTGIAVPDSVACNAGKYHFASGFHAAIAEVQDIAGGLIATAPGVEDLEADSVVAAYVEKYLAGRAGIGGAERWHVAQLIRDLTASEFGGYNQVVTLHGEGSLAAQLVQTVRDYDIDRCVSFAQDVVSGRAVPRTPWLPEGSDD